MRPEGVGLAARWAWCAARQTKRDSQRSALGGPRKQHVSPLRYTGPKQSTLGSGTEFAPLRYAVLIAGGSRGLGLALARECARVGCRLVLAARDAQELAHARQDLTQRGAEVLAVPCDEPGTGPLCSGPGHTAFWVR